MLRTQYLSYLAILSNSPSKAVNMLKRLKLYEYEWICYGRLSHAP
jgi:hypothetical protein